MIRTILFSTVFFIAARANEPAAKASVKSIESYGTWKVAGTADGVRSWVRWIHFSDGTKTRERKGEFTFEGSLKEAMDILTDAESTKKWASGVEENYRIKGSNRNEMVIYTLYDIPWPFHKRDLVSVYALKVNSDNLSAVITIKSQPENVPLKPGIERLVDYSARWTVKENGAGTFQITFSAMSDTPPLFPRYIQDPVIERMFHNNLVTLKEILAEKANR